MISNQRTLEIMNIQRSAAGIYTCVAISRSGATMNSTVNVTVQCEYHDSIMQLVHANIKLLCITRYGSTLIVQVNEKFFELKRDI